MTTTSAATEPTTKTDRAEANRRNAQKSTGPRTAEGKDRSRFNAVKHGMTAKTLVLPGEDPEALQLRLDGWNDSLKPKNDLEHYLVERAVRVSWQLDRADRAEVARLAARIRDDEFRDSYSQVSVDVVALGRRLFWDRRGPLELYPHFPLKDQLLADKKPRTSFSGLADDPDDPERLLIQLERSEAGCLWLLQQWAELRDILDEDLLWQSIDRFKAIRLLGRQPTDAADFSDVTTIYLACWIMHPQVKRDRPVPGRLQRVAGRRGGPVPPAAGRPRGRGLHPRGQGRGQGEAAGDRDEGRRSAEDPVEGPRGSGRGRGRPTGPPGWRSTTATRGNGCDGSRSPAADR